MPLIKSIAQETAEQCGSYISNDNAAFLGHRLGFDYKAVVHGNDIFQYVKQLSMLSNPISENDIIAVVPEHKPDDIWVMKSGMKCCKSHADGRYHLPAEKRQPNKHTFRYAYRCPTGI